MSRDRITRAEVEQLLEEWSEELVKTLVRVLGPAGVEDPGSRAARRRAEELRQTDPILADQVASVAKARREGTYVSVGRDVGHRSGAGVYKLDGAEADDEDAVGPAQRAIRRRLGKRGDT